MNVELIAKTTQKMESVELPDDDQKTIFTAF